MPLTIRCPMCSKDYHLADEQAGRRVRCRECRCEFDVAGLPERLEVVEAPRRGRRGMPNQEIPVVPELVRERPRNRTLLYVLLGGGACLALSLLACGGVVWMVLSPKPPPVVKQVARGLDIPRPAPPPPPPAPVEAPAPVAARQAEGDGIDLLGATIKDFNDALAKLKDPRFLTRLRALEYLGKQKVPDDPAKRKVVLDAVEPLTKDDNTFVKAAAAQVKLIWGGFD
jgi:hypothetical protein